LRKTLVGCLALVGEDARPTDGAVDIVIEDRIIRDIRPTRVAAPEGELIDLTGRLVTAGLINGHHHSHEGFFKGRNDVLSLELWMRALKPIALTPRDIYLRTMIGAIEAVRSGTTTLGDDANVGAVIDPEHVDAVFQAYEDIGIRAYVGVTLFDKPFIRAVPFVEEEVPLDMVRELETMPMMRSGERLDFVRGLARTRHPKHHRIGCMVCPSAPQRCTEGFLRDVRTFADDFDLPVMMHVQETRMQVVTGKLWWGTTMIEYLERIGFLKPHTQLIHAIWLNPREIDVLARAGVTVQHNPASALRSGSGLAPVRALLEAGVNVSLGTDGCGSIEGTDMQNVLYLAPLLQRLRGDNANWILAKDAFRASTLGGAKAFGRGRELGAITKGRIADLVAFRIDGIAFTPLNDPINQLVYSGRKQVDLVMVDGDVVLANGRLTRIDEDCLLDEIRAAHERLAPLLLAAEKDGERFHAPFERIYRRCEAIGIAPDTYPARLPH
jgi:5-methylthioadenosine/S-adenosylhomocysteine deaminase